MKYLQVGYHMYRGVGWWVNLLGCWIGSWLFDAAGTLMASSFSHGSAFRAYGARVFSLFVPVHLNRSSVPVWEGFSMLQPSVVVDSCASYQCSAYGWGQRPPLSSLPSLALMLLLCLGFWGGISRTILPHHPHASCNPHGFDIKAYLAPVPSSTSTPVGREIRKGEDWNFPAFLLPRSWGFCLQRQ